MNTSYFAKLKSITNPLSISGKAPDWYSGPQYRILAPKYGFFSAYKAGEIDSVGYTECYYDQVLRHLDASQVYQYLVQTYGENVTLLCYEKPGDFCHRRLVADWFETYLGIPVLELKF